LGWFPAGAAPRYTPPAERESTIPEENVAGPKTLVAVREAVATFAEVEGRRPRFIVVRLGDDGDDEGAAVLASAFADSGFDVDMGPPGQTAQNAARAAVENDVHGIGVALTAAHEVTHIPRLVRSLGELGGGHIMVICRGPVPTASRDSLYEVGAAAVLRPHEDITATAAEFVDILLAAYQP